ncbi:MAG: GNAT family N-acetyltransferase [Candidatus Limnocylindrales bacterium]
MTSEIRPVPAADMRRWFEAVMVAFGEDVNEEQWALDQKLLEPERVLGAYVDGEVVGGGAAFTFQMTVPGGGRVPTAGVTMVGMMPTHRRQGLLRQLMARQLADVRAAGEPLAALWASEGSIYQRFGYGLGSLNGSIDIERSRAVFRQPISAQGSVHLRDVSSAKPDMTAVYDIVRAATPGFYERSSEWWDVLLADPEFRRQGASKRFHAVAMRDGRAVGYVLYRVKSDWTDTGPANTLIVVELLAVDAQATQQLWTYVFGVDLMSRIRARLGPADHPLLLLVTEPRRLQLRISDGLWLRVVDVPAALAGRRYATDGSIVLDVTDEFMPEVAGRWRLTVSEGRGRTEPTMDPADLQLEINDLGSVYLGAVSFASLGRAGRTIELSNGARPRGDAMFESPIPAWCPEIF